MTTGQETLLARCENCASWRDAELGAPPGHRTALAVNGVCTRGLAPPAGDVRCESYTASERFQQQLISRLLQEDPMALPVPLRGVVQTRKAQLARARKSR